MNKAALRYQLLSIREALSTERREEAKRALFSYLLPSSTQTILSFVSFQNEIDTSLINNHFAEQQNLHLPMIEGSSLKIFQISDLQNHLKPNSFGIMEPDPAFCTEVNPETIEIILVPALGFDHYNNRLGYGKGYYDRFLKKYSKSRTIGIGFKEQLIAKIPCDPHDVPLQKVSLF